MGKIKSAIITALLAAAIVVLAVFALGSWQVPGSNGVKRYNSFISNIHLGADMTGEAVSLLYPDGVISREDYDFSMPEIPEDATEEERAEYEEKREEFAAKYVQCGNLYIKNDAIDEIGLDGLKEKVANDAKILSDRFGEKGYSAYSVSVQDDYTIRVTVPTNFTYAAYKQYDATARSNETTKISRAVQILSYKGELTLRNSEVKTLGIYDSKLGNYLLTPNVDISNYFKSVSKYSAGGSHAVRIGLTSAGREQFKKITGALLDASDTAIGFYVGDNQLISLNVTDVIDDNGFAIQVDDAAYAQDYSIILNSVVHGETVSLDYVSDGVTVVCGTAAMGGNAAMLLGIAILLILLGAIIYSVVKYKKLGIVNALMILVYALAMITVLMLIETQLTIAGVITAVLGLALLCGSNFSVFEAVRKETKKGKTMQSSVKSGYRSRLLGIIDLHVILFVASLLVALVCAGELAACGMIFFIATISSYVLYWFTRFMWYVISSPAKNKFGFCGFTREEMLDD